jgi:hypothetical protein
MHWVVLLYRGMLWTCLAMGAQLAACFCLFLLGLLPSTYCELHRITTQETVLSAVYRHGQWKQEKGWGGKTSLIQSCQYSVQLVLLCPWETETNKQQFLMCSLMLNELVGEQGHRDRNLGQWPARLLSSGKMTERKKSILRWCTWSECGLPLNNPLMLWTKQDRTGSHFRELLCWSSLIWQSYWAW